MAANLVTLATVISIRPLGENNSSVTFLTQNEGIVYATMYGGPKSKMKSLVSPWNSGTLYLSMTKQDFYKISDFDVKTYHLTFRENLLKSWIANLAAEIAIKTKCGGSPGKCWALINGFIDGLEFCKEDDQCIAGMIRFLWRYLELMGLQPETEKCCHCGETFTSGAAWNPAENGFCCSYCDQGKSPLKISQNSIQYLNAVSSLTATQARQVQLQEESVSALKQLLYHLIESACNSSLTTLRTGAGIL